MSEELRSVELEQLRVDYQTVKTDPKAQQAKAQEIAGAGNNAGAQDVLALFQSWNTGDTMAEHFPVPVLREILVWIEKQAQTEDLAWTGLHYDLYAQNPTLWDRVLADVPATRMALLVRLTVYSRVPEDPTGSKTLEKYRAALGPGLPALGFYNSAGRLLTGLPLGVTFARIGFQADRGWKLGQLWSTLMSTVRDVNQSKTALVNPPVLVFDSKRVQAKIRELLQEKPEQPGKVKPNLLPLLAAGGAILLKNPLPLALLLVKPGEPAPAGKPKQEGR